IREIIDSKDFEKLKPFHDKYSRVRDIINSIQTLKKESISPLLFNQRIKDIKEDYEANPKLKGGKPTNTWLKGLEKFSVMFELQEIYNLYQEYLQNEGYYDYEDMIMFVIDKFKTDEELLAHYQEKFL